MLGQRQLRAGSRAIAESTFDWLTTASDETTISRFRVERKNVRLARICLPRSGPTDSDDERAIAIPAILTILTDSSGKMRTLQRCFG